MEILIFINLGKNKMINTFDLGLFLITCSIPLAMLIVLIIDEIIQMFIYFTLNIKYVMRRLK